MEMVTDWVRCVSVTFLLSNEAQTSKPKCLTSSYWNSFHSVTGLNSCQKWKLSQWMFLIFYLPFQTYEPIHTGSCGLWAVEFYLERSKSIIIYSVSVCLSLNDLSVLMVESWWQTKEFLSEPLLLKATHSQVSFLCSVLPGAITSFLIGYKTIYVCIRKFTSYTRKIDFNVNTHTGRLESW